MLEAEKPVTGSELNTSGTITPSVVSAQRNTLAGTEETTEGSVNIDESAVRVSHNEEGLAADTCAPCGADRVADTIQCSGARNDKPSSESIWGTIRPGGRSVLRTARATDEDLRICSERKRRRSEGGKEDFFHGLEDLLKVVS